MVNESRITRLESESKNLIEKNKKVMETIAMIRAKSRTYGLYFFTKSSLFTKK